MAVADDDGDGKGGVGRGVMKTVGGWRGGGVLMMGIGNRGGEGVLMIQV